MRCWLHFGVGLLGGGGVLCTYLVPKRLGRSYVELLSSLWILAQRAYTMYAVTTPPHACILPAVGGALYSSRSDVHLDGSTYVTHNSGYDGGEHGLGRCSVVCYIQ